MLSSSHIWVMYRVWWMETKIEEYWNICLPRRSLKPRTSHIFEMVFTMSVSCLLVLAATKLRRQGFWQARLFSRWGGRKERGRHVVMKPCVVSLSWSSRYQARGACFKPAVQLHDTTGNILVTVLVSNPNCSNSPCSSVIIGMPIDMNPSTWKNNPTEIRQNSCESTSCVSAVCVL